MKRSLPYIALTLAVGELLLVMGSWILSAALPMSGIRSMLSGEGIRFFLGHFADLLATPLLVWLLLLAMAYGVVLRSGVISGARSFRSSRARLIALLFAAAYLAEVLLMALVPHAVLLAASGTLWPSPFSASLVPLTAFGLAMVAAVYGIVAGTITSLADIYESFVDGLRRAAALLPICILLVLICESLYFIIP
jgi:aminobenzoyl-glutamate transport protein